MRCWNEIEKDVFLYYDFFSKDEASSILGCIPDLSLFSINGERISEKDIFIGECEKQLKKIFLQESFAEKYKFYLIAHIEVMDNNSRVEKYKKVWKRLQSKWNLEGFNKGPEVETNLNGHIFYSSIAEFSIEKMEIALGLLARYRYRFTVVVSQRDDIFSKDSIREIIAASFRSSNDKYPVIDYFYLSLKLCLKGDIVLRWGDSSEDAELALIFKSELLEYFQTVC